MIQSASARVMVSCHLDEDSPRSSHSLTKFTQIRKDICRSKHICPHKAGPLRVSGTFHKRGPRYAGAPLSTTNSQSTPLPLTQNPTYEIGSSPPQPPRFPTVCFLVAMTGRGDSSLGQPAFSLVVENRQGSLTPNNCISAQGKRSS